MGPPVLDGGIGGDQVVPVCAEGVAGLDGVPARVLQVPEGDDVMPALLEVDCRPDDQVDLRPVAGSFGSFPFSESIGFVSSSAQIGCRCPVSALITTTG